MRLRWLRHWAPMRTRMWAWRRHLHLPTGRALRKMAMAAPPVSRRGTNGARATRFSATSHVCTTAQRTSGATTASRQIGQCQRAQPASAMQQVAAVCVARQPLQDLHRRRPRCHHHHLLHRRPYHHRQRHHAHPFRYLPPTRWSMGGAVFSAATASSACSPVTLAPTARTSRCPTRGSLTQSQTVTVS